ncbi:MAG TPA: pitrilysin family protein [Thermoanaerobaculia bacterium]|nr:pitrilysin family protein [Thermoanaerobaculia bacterium]
MTALDRSRPPSPLADVPCRFPSFRRERLAAGLTAYVLEQRRTPLVSMRLSYPWSGASDPPDRSGLAAFVASLLEDGTTTRSSRQIAEEIESLGGSLGSGAGWSSAAVSARVLSRDLDTGLELLSDVASNPAFAEAEVERQRRERLAEWLRRRDQPGALAEEAFSAAVYGASPYGHSLLGDDSSLRAIRREEIVRFWTERRTARDASLVVVGDVDTDRMLAAAERALAGLGSAEPPQPPPLVAPPQRRRVVVVDRPGAAQTELRVGHAGPPRNHPDHTELLLGNTILGGKFTSRINLNLRERHGFTYGAHSAFVDRRGPGPFLVWTAVANQAVARASEEILAEIARLRDEPVEAAELEEGIRYLRGVFPYGLQSQSGLLGRLEEIAVYGLDDDHFDRHLEELTTIGPGRLRRVLREHLDPEKATVVAVGPAGALASELARFGPVQVLKSVPAAA